MEENLILQEYEKSLTECRAENEVLAESVKQYRASIEEIEDGYAEIDPTGKVTFFNSSFLRIFALSPQEMAESDPRTLVEPETLRVASKSYLKVLETGVPDKGIVHEFRKADGSKGVIEVSVSPKVNTEGLPIATRCIVRDITERKHAEEEIARHRNLLEAIFRSVNEAVITVNKDMRVIEVNKATEEICGLNRTEIVGKVFKNCIKHCRESCQEVLQNALESRRTIKDYRIECKHKNKPYQITMVTASPLLDHDNEFMGAVLVLRDISRLNTLENELTERYQFHNMIGQSSKMQEIYDLLETLSDIETTVLITGESGTGKEMVSKALHYSGDRKDKPLIKVNCSALSENLLESELFGHVKGAFTGAVSDRQGRFQAAEGGTILLDEIGDISPGIQLKLLRVLDEKEFERVGESTPTKANVRVIAATNRDLKEKVRAGEFREDLYYRLKVIEIALPPLRERPEDIPLLVDHFCKRFNDTFRKRIEGVSTEALKCFMNYPWPGNVRELRHCLERAFILCRDRTIVLDHLPQDLRQYAEKKWIIPVKKTAANHHDILEVLNRTGWDKSEAARLLGIHRATLYRNIAKYKLDMHNPKPRKRRKKAPNKKSGATA
jgi:two-component system, NtrC family, response regulator HydG